MAAGLLFNQVQHFAQAPGDLRAATNSRHQSLERSTRWGMIDAVDRVLVHGRRRAGLAGSGNLAGHSTLRVTDGTAYLATPGMARFLALERW